MILSVGRIIRFRVNGLTYAIANSFIGALAIALLVKRRIPISSLHLLQGWYLQRLLSNELKDR